MPKSIHMFGLLALALSMSTISPTSFAEEGDEPEASEGMPRVMPGVFGAGKGRGIRSLPNGASSAPIALPEGRRPAPAQESGAKSKSSSTSDAEPPPITEDGDRQRPPKLKGAKKVSVDMLNTNVYDLVKFYAEITGKNAIIGDIKELKGEEVSIISNQMVTIPAAEQAIISAIEVAGYTLVFNGSTIQVVQVKDAITKPIRVGKGDDIPRTDIFVTQMIPLQNINGADISTIVNALVSADGKVLNYAPSNTLIITESANNLRRIYKIIQDLDIAAPKSRMEIISLEYAEAVEIKAILAELYGVGVESSSSKKTSTKKGSSRRRPKRDEPAKNSDAVSAGKEANYISKVLADERTNSLIVLANEQGLIAVKELVTELDVDVDITSRSQIHVVYLENAKAEDVANVLSNLADSGGGSTSKSKGRVSPSKSKSTSSTSKSKKGGETKSTGVTAAFDSGMRITHDEDTNSLIVIASNDDFRIISRVISKLDIVRRQVFVDAVVLELSSDDTAELGFAYHGPLSESSDLLTFGGAQLGSSSLGLSQDMLSGLAVGAFGEAISVPFSDGTELSIPAFGVVLNALKSNSAVNIISNPQIWTVDNQEAEIIVGRKIPFPTSQSMNSLGQPVVSYQREDVAISLKVTPRINSSNSVTLELHLEVSEVEEDDSGLDPNQAGFITSKREISTFALVDNNETIVLGGLMGTTDTEVETKIPILGDMPLIGALFRGSRDSSRKTNLMVFITPHIVDDEYDMQEIMQVKEAQRQEFIRRFYGRSRDKQMAEIRKLLAYSMNHPGEDKVFIDDTVDDEITLDGTPLSEEARLVIQEELDAAKVTETEETPGELAEDQVGTLEVASEPADQAE
jgi:general secretion pathway protein D